MTTTHAHELPSPKPLRLWPGVVAAALLLLFKLVAVPLVAPGRPRRVAGRTRGRVGNRRVVGVLQSGAVVRTGGRCRADGRRDVRNLARSPRVDCDGARRDVVSILALPALSFALVVWALASRRLSNGLVARRWSPPSC